MNELERMMRQWKNQARNWFQSQFKKGDGQDRPKIRMCPSCGNFVGINDPSCHYCGTVFDTPAPQRRGEAETNQGEEFGSTLMVFGFCVIAYILSIILSSRFTGAATLGSWWSPVGQALSMMGANTTDDTLVRGEYWRLTTYMFLHGDGLHIIMNMMALAQLGPLSHNNFQTRRFWLICLITGIAGGILSAGSYIVTRHYSLSVGFSGALFGLLGANWVFAKRHGYREFADRLKAFMIWGNVICIVLTFFNILRIDNWAHLGGMFAGIMLGYLFTAPVQPDSARWVERAVLTGLIGFTLFGFSQVGLDFWNAWR